MKRTLVHVAALVGIAGLALSSAPVFPQENAPAGGAPAGAPMQPGKKGHRKKEGHPQIQAAIRALENAKNHLEHAAHDFKGHRVAALEHVNKALEELHLALQADPD